MATSDTWPIKAILRILTLFRPFLDGRRLSGQVLLLFPLQPTFLDPTFLDPTIESSLPLGLPGGSHHSCYNPGTYWDLILLRVGLMVRLEGENKQYERIEGLHDVITYYIVISLKVSGFEWDQGYTRVFLWLVLRKANLLLPFIKLTYTFT